MYYTVSLPSMRRLTNYKLKYEHVLGYIVASQVSQLGPKALWLTNTLLLGYSNLFQLYELVEVGSERRSERCISGKFVVRQLRKKWG